MRAVLFSVFILAVVASTHSASAGLLTTFSFQVGDFVESPTQPVIYATVPSENAVAVINANTLQVTNTIPIGSNPAGLTISPDGSTLYVADSGSSFVARLNTATLTQLTPLVSPSGNPTAVQFGNSNRLWVLGSGGINQMDATTGLSTGPGLGGGNNSFPLVVSGGSLLISSDGNSLYYGNAGLSPAYAYKYDVSGTTPTQEWVTGGGGDGSGMVLNHAGTVFAFSKTGDSNLALLDTANELTLGTVGSRGNALAFSADDSTIYTAIDFTYAVNAWSTSTYLQTGNIPTASEPEDLFTDNSGNDLYVSELGETQVFSVGPVPEPTTAALAVFGFGGLLLRRRRTAV